MMLSNILYTTVTSRHHLPISSPDLKISGVDHPAEDEGKWGEINIERDDLQLQYSLYMGEHAWGKMSKDLRQDDSEGSNNHGVR